MRKIIILIFALLLLVSIVYALPEQVLNYCNMEEGSGTTICDTISLTLTGAPTFEQNNNPKFGNGNSQGSYVLGFDGSANKYASASSTNLTNTIDPWGFAAWVFRNDTANWIYLQGQDAGSDPDKWVSITAAGNLRCYSHVCSGACNFDFVETTGITLGTGTWHHVGCYWSGSSFEAWVNGTNRSYTTTGSPVDPGTSPDVHYLGINRPNGGGYSKIQLDEVYLFGDLPDAEQRYNLYQYGNLTAPSALDITPPEITYYNLTSSDNGCENWNTDKSNACSTHSVTPTVQFNTSENAWCAVAGSSSSTSLNLNYTDMGSSRNCTGAASGEGTREHFCTLMLQDEFVYDTSYLFISCKDANNNQNSTSTSGALKLSITGLEAAGRNSIGLGIQNALLDGYTNYTDLQIYARNLADSQVIGTFDRVAVKGNKTWAFNRIGISDSHVNMFNITPVLYTLEFANTTSARITNLTELMINATK